MLHLRAQAGLELLELDDCLVLAGMLFECIDLARPLGGKLVGLHPGQLFTLLCALVAGIGHH